MNQRDRLLAAFDRTPLDHLPWVPDLGYWIEAESIRGTLPEKYRAPDQRHLVYVDLDACVYYGCPASPVQVETPGVTQTSEKRGDRWIRRLECDGHGLEEHRRWLPASYCYAIVKYFVTDVSQLALVREIVGRRRYTPNPQADEPAQRLDGWGVPITAMPRSPLPALLADWVGVEGTIFMLADHPAEVEKTLEAIDRANDGFFAHLGNIANRLCHFCDNLSAETIAGYWDRYCAEYYRRRVAQVHAAGKYCVTHLDGTTRALIPRLMAAGLDGIESLTPHPVGDIPMEEMARLLEPHDGLFWGGLPGAMFAPPFGWDDLRRMIDGLHRLYRRGLRVVVASADQVPPDADIDRLRRVPRYLAGLGA